MLTLLLVTRPVPAPRLSAPLLAQDKQPQVQPFFDMQPLESQFAAIAFSRPMTNEALRTYMLGRWRVKRATKYTRGGISGRFQGAAEFSPLRNDDGRTLADSEGAG